MVKFFIEHLSHYAMLCYAKSLQSCLTLCEPIDGRQPTSLPRPWDSPGKNTGMGCHFLLQCMKVKSESEVTQSCLTLSDPMDCSLPGSSVHGIFQARVLEWGAIVFYVQNTSERYNIGVQSKLHNDKGQSSHFLLGFLLGIYYVPSLLFYLIFLATLRGKHPHLHFTDEETWVRKASLPLVCHENRIPTQTRVTVTILQTLHISETIMLSFQHLYSNCLYQDIF